MAAANLPLRARLFPHMHMSFTAMHTVQASECAGSGRIHSCVSNMKTLQGHRRHSVSYVGRSTYPSEDTLLLRHLGEVYQINKHNNELSE
jgi:hypothetical protein